MSIQEKFENFKVFVKQVSKNQETIALYEDMSWMKLQSMAYVLLLPNRNRLDEIIPEMQKKLDFSDEHLPKFKRYIELFVEYISGGSETKPPEYITSQNMSFDDRMALYMKEQQLKNL
jgi:hypothetical protein